jgi:hypothetical protein
MKLNELEKYDLKKRDHWHFNYDQDFDFFLWGLLALIFFGLFGYAELFGIFGTSIVNGVIGIIFLMLYVSLAITLGYFYWKKDIEYVLVKRSGGDNE